MRHEACSTKLFNLALRRLNKLMNLQQLMNLNIITLVIKLNKNSVQFVCMPRTPISINKIHL